VQALEKSFDAAGQGAAALRRNIIDITHRNLNLGFELAKSLAAARNLYEIVELQTAYWRKQFDAVTTQADEMHIRLFEFGAAKHKTAQPSSEFISHEPTRKAPLRIQEAPKKKESPAARDRVAWQRRDTDTLARPPAAGPTVRPRVERQTTTQKKSALEDEPIGQSLPTDIKFGMLDGNAVRFTNQEAWWLVDVDWRPISLDEVLLNAAVMREARFNQLFPKVPQLPSNAFNSANPQD
jgi:Phasin protein